MALAKQFALVLLCGTAAAPQRSPTLASRTVSARAGTINYLAGMAYVDEKRVVIKPGLSPQMKDGQQLHVVTGKVEVLLGAGVYLRLGDASTIRMSQTQLDDIHMSVENGSAVIEIADMNKGSRLRVMCGEAIAELRHDGVYRFDNLPEKSLRIFKGDVEVNFEASSVIGKKGQAVKLANGLELSGFDLKATDSLQLWAMRRSQQRIDSQRRRMEARRMQEAKQKALFDELHQDQ